MDSRALVCSYGNAQRLFRIADVSNGDFSPVCPSPLFSPWLLVVYSRQDEFKRWQMVNEADRVRSPQRSELEKKHLAIKELRDRGMTDEEINRQVEARKQSNPAQQRAKAVVEITQLYQARNLALRRNDHESAANLERQIIALGGNPETGLLVDASKVASGLAQSAKDSVAESYEDKIQRINEHNKKRTKEMQAAAHQASLQRKRAEEAIVRARQ